MPQPKPTDFDEALDNDAEALDAAGEQALKEAGDDVTDKARDDTW